MGKNVEYTLDELIDAQDTPPEFRNPHQKAIITTFKRNQYWKNYHEEQEKNFTYAVQLPKPWDAIAIKRDPVHYTHEELIEARKTPESERTPRQNAILESLNNRRYYAYMRKHSPTPEWNKHITRVLTDIDNVEDVLSTAGWAFFAAGILIPFAAPILDAIGGMLEAATVPLNLVEAALGITTGPMGAKRAFESLVRLTPMGRILKIGHCGLLRAMEKKLFSSGILRQLAMRAGPDIRKEIGKLPLRQRIKYALPNWGTALEAGQAAQTITGNGLILGPFFGAATEMTFAGYRIIQGKKVKIYMPWEKPDLQTRIAAHAAPSVARLMMHSGSLTPTQQLKIMMVNAYVTQKLKDYWKDKDITPYIDAIAESDTMTYQEPASGSTMAMESLGYKIDPEDKSYLTAKEQIDEETIMSFEARTIQEEMQAILQKKDTAVKNIINTHKGYLSEQIVGNTINTAAEATASTVAGKDQEPNIDLRADFKVALALLQHNILPLNFIDYGCGIPGTAFGFSIDYSKKEVMNDLNITAKDTRYCMTHKNAGKWALDRINFMWKYFIKTQHLPKDYMPIYEDIEGIQLSKGIQRPEKYYSWYFDIFDYWRKELRKLTRLYIKGQITLTPQSILKHIAFPEPDLYDHNTGETTHKKLTWVFKAQENVWIAPTLYDWTTIACKCIDDIYRYHWTYDTRIGVTDDLWRAYFGSDEPNWENFNGWFKPQQKRFNEILEHTFQAVMRIAGWEEINPIEVFNPYIQDIETEKKKMRLIGSSSPPYINSWNMLWFPQKERNTEEFLRGTLPYLLRFFIYKKPPLFILTPEEKEMAIKYGAAPPAWHNNTRLRNIFHKYLVTRPYDYDYPEIEPDLDTLEDWYYEMLREGIKLPNWPTATVKKLKQTGKDKGAMQPGVKYTSVQTFEKKILEAQKQIENIVTTETPEVTTAEDGTTHYQYSGTVGGETPTVWSNVDLTPTQIKNIITTQSPTVIKEGGKVTWKYTFTTSNQPTRTQPKITIYKTKPYKTVMVPQVISEEGGAGVTGERNSTYTPFINGNPVDISGASRKHVVTITTA